MRALLTCAGLLLAGALPSAAQAPTGLLTGRIESALNRQPVAGGTVRGP